MRTVLFHRRFQDFTGGHLKVWNYFNHVEAAAGCRAQIYFSPGSRWDAGNPWWQRREEILPEWQPERADTLFLGGFDWRMLPEDERDRYKCPVVNLVQHVHHGDPRHPLSGFLRHRAIRLCASREVQEAITARGVNGPTFVIPYGLEMADFPPVIPRAARPVEWLICGLKEDRSKIARSVARRMEEAGDWGVVRLLTKLLPRAEYLAALAEARNVLLLPRATEGFYLPALEAMALGTFVVCPDCVGNRSFCLDGDNALVPAGYDVDQLHAALGTARALGERREPMVESAYRTAAEHTLARERATFHGILAQAEALW